MSTKVTRLYGKDYHLFTDYAVDCGHTLILKVKGKKVELPKEFMEALRKLLLLQDAFKALSQTSAELDKIDAGIFVFKIKKSKKLKGVPEVQ